MARKNEILNCALLLIVVQLTLLGTTDTQRILDRCSLAREMDELGVARDELARWVMIADRASDFQTDVVSAADAEGYVYYGLFQFSSRYWCKPSNDQGLEKSENICEVNCAELLASNIKASVLCAQQVKKLKDWEPWEMHLKYFDTSNQTSVEDCFDAAMGFDGSTIGVSITSCSKDFM